MAQPPFPIPAEVVEWIRSVFASVNRRVSTKLTRIPTTHETSLDMSFIEELSHHEIPVEFSSGWLVRLETHYLGGGRYWGEWEIADVGVLVIFRRGGVVQQTKIALLQSKRLYAVEAKTDAEDQPIDYFIGFGRLLPAVQEYKSSVKKRRFSLVEDSRYRAMEFEGKQYQAILQYQKQTTVPVHYLLYNPLAIPITVTLPVEGAGSTVVNDHPLVGCRVISASELDTKLKAQHLKSGESPVFKQIFSANYLDASPPWKLEYFVADLVLSCKEGHVAGINPMEDEALFRIFNERSGPISAAIAITIDAPGEVTAS